MDSDPTLGVGVGVDVDVAVDAISLFGGFDTIIDGGVVMGCWCLVTEQRR